MFFLQHLNTAAILVLFVLASLIEGQDNSKSFTLHQRSRSSVKSGPAPVLSMYHKFNKRAPENVQNAAAVRNGAVIASPSKFDQQFLTPITIGGQTLDLQLDTGSNFL